MNLSPTGAATTALKKLQDLPSGKRQSEGRKLVNELLDQFKGRRADELTLLRTVRSAPRWLPGSAITTALKLASSGFGALGPAIAEVALEACKSKTNPIQQGRHFSKQLAKRGSKDEAMVARAAAEVSKSESLGWTRLTVLERSLSTIKSGIEEGDGPGRLVTLAQDLGAALDASDHVTDQRKATLTELLVKAIARADGQEMPDGETLAKLDSFLNDSRSRNSFVKPGGDDKVEGPEELLFLADFVRDEKVRAEVLESGLDLVNEAAKKSPSRKLAGTLRGLLVGQKVPPSRELELLNLVRNVYSNLAVDFGSEREKKLASLLARPVEDMALDEVYLHANYTQEVLQIAHEGVDSFPNLPARIADAVLASIPKSQWFRTADSSMRFAHDQLDHMHALWGLENANLPIELERGGEDTRTSKWRVHKTPMGWGLPQGGYQSLDNRQRDAGGDGKTDHEGLTPLIAALERIAALRFEDRPG